MLNPAGAQMVRDVVAGTGTTVRELSGWISFGILPAIAYVYDRPRWMKWVTVWAAVAAGWMLAGRPDRNIWTSDVSGAIWIALALATHVLAIWMRFAIHR